MLLSAPESASSVVAAPFPADLPRFRCRFDSDRPLHAPFTAAQEKVIGLFEIADTSAINGPRKWKNSKASFNLDKCVTAPSPSRETGTVWPLNLLRNIKHEK